MATVSAKRRQRQKKRTRLRRGEGGGSRPPSPKVEVHAEREGGEVEGTRSSRRRARQRRRRLVDAATATTGQQDLSPAVDNRFNTLGDAGVPPEDGREVAQNPVGHVVVVGSSEPTPHGLETHDDDNDSSGADRNSTPCPPPRPRTCPVPVAAPRSPSRATSPSSEGHTSSSSLAPSTPCPSPRPQVFPAPLLFEDEASDNTDNTWGSTPSTPCPSPRQQRREPRTPTPTPAPQESPTPFFTPPSSFSSPHTPASTDLSAERFFTPMLYSPEQFSAPKRFYNPEIATPSPASSAAVSALLWRDDSPEARDEAGNEAGDGANTEADDKRDIYAPVQRTPRARLALSPHTPPPRPTSVPRLTLSPSRTPSTTALSPLPTSSAAVASTQPRSALDSELLDAGSSAAVGAWASSDASGAAEAGDVRAGAAREPSLTDTDTNTDTTTDGTTEADTKPHPFASTWPRDVRLPLKGFHVSSDGGLSALSSRARALRAAIPANQSMGVQAFCGSPRRHALPALDPADARAFRDAHDTSTWAVHANHTTNLASSDEKTALAGLDFVAREMRRCLDLGVPVLCVHLGSDVRAADDDAVVERVARALRELLATVPGVILALENMVRASVCTQPWSLTLLARILDAVDSPRAAACVDICHAHIAEYDLSTARGIEALETVLAREVRWERIAGFHVSDAATPHGRACDGHASIGDGLIPLSAFRRILRHPAVLGRVPYYLETPAYAPSLRPAAFPAVARWEAARHLAEWAFLERVVCMPAGVWAARRGVEVAQYRSERERCHMAIRNLLRPGRACARREGKPPSGADSAAAAIAAFRSDRRAALVRAAIVRHARERTPLSSPSSPRSADARAADEATTLAYASFTLRGGYTMRHRAVSVKLE